MKKEEKKKEEKKNIVVKPEEKGKFPVKGKKKEDIAKNNMKWDKNKSKKKK